MKIFSGFPSGKLQVTPVPNLFFSELCPAIADLAELKLTLHCFWLFAHARNRAPYVTARELLADRTLVQSLAVLGKPEETLAHALALAVERGTLLRLAAPEDTFFLNSESGRMAFERMQSRDEHASSGAPFAEPEPVHADVRPNIFHLYEQNIGLLTPMIAEELKEAEATYPAEWFADAFKIAVENNKRNWHYIRKILERWKAEGRDGDSKKRKPWWNDEYDKFVNR